MRWTGQNIVQEGTYSEQRYKVKTEEGFVQCCHIRAIEFFCFFFNVIKL